MQITIENRGVAAVELSALCGDATYQATLLPAGTANWEPTANACSLAVSGKAAGRLLAIRNQCRHASGCSLGVRLPATTQLVGSGQIEIVEDAATVVSSAAR